MSNALILQPLPATATASSSAPGYDPAFALNDFVGVVWKSAAGASADLFLDLGADVPVDTVLLFGCDGATGAWTLQVAANTAAQGSSFAAPGYTSAVVPFLAGAEMPTSGRGTALWQAPTGFPAAVRYLRIRVAGLAGGAATIGRAVVGADLKLERNFSAGMSVGVKDLGGIDFSRFGGLLRKAGAKLRTLSVTFASINKDEVEAAVQPLLEQIGNTRTLAIVTDPSPHAMRQRRAFFGPLVGDVGATQRRARFWQSQLQLVSLV